VLPVLIYLVHTHPGLINIINKRRKHVTNITYYLKQTCTYLIFWMSDFTCCCDVYSGLTVPPCSWARETETHTSFSSSSSSCWMCLHCIHWQNCLFIYFI